MGRNARGGLSSYRKLSITKEKIKQWNKEEEFGVGFRKGCFFSLIVWEGETGLTGEDIEKKRIWLQVANLLLMEEIAWRQKSQEPNG